MVLDGGFPSLVTQLWQSRGSMEPVIINHDHDRWLNYLVVTGRVHSLKTDFQISKDYLNSSRTVTASSSMPQVAGDVSGMSKNSELEHARIALEVAIRLGHVHMSNILEERIERLQRQTQEQIN